MLLKESLTQVHESLTSSGGLVQVQPVYVVDVAEALYRSLEFADAKGSAYDLGGPEGPMMCASMPLPSTCRVPCAVCLSASAFHMPCAMRCVPLCSCFPHAV